MSRLHVPGTANLCPKDPTCCVEPEAPEDLRSDDLKDQEVEPEDQPEGRMRNGPPHAHLAAHGPLHEQRYVGKRELDQRYPVSDMTRWRWINDPRVAFPKPVKLGPNGRNFWWLPDILEWKRRRSAGRSIGGTR